MDCELELEILLKHFDYTYMMSDDHRVWLHGVRNEKEVRKLIKKLVLVDKERVKTLILKYAEEFGAQFINEVEE